MQNIFGALSAILILETLIVVETELDPPEPNKNGCLQFWRDDLPVLRCRDKPCRPLRINGQNENCWCFVRKRHILVE